MEEDDLKALTAIQLRVIMCRNLSGVMEDRGSSERLYALANEMARIAREVDGELCSPE